MNVLHEILCGDGGQVLHEVFNGRGRGFLPVGGAGHLITAWGHLHRVVRGAGVERV